MASFQTGPSADGGSGLMWIFNHLPSILWQRRILVLATFAIFVAAGVIAAYALPTLYRSSATLLVQSQDLPSKIVESPATGAIEQRIARIRERVLSRGDLVSLMEQNDLYADERRSQPLSDVVEKMRKATSVGALAGDIGQPGGGQSNTVAIRMSFDYREPAKAQAVLQSYVASFVRLDSEDVEDQASLTVRFLQDQAAKLRSEIGQIERQLTELKARNGAALASSGAPPFVDTGSYSVQISSLQNENRQLVARLDGSTRSDPQLAEAEAALAAARAIYQETHPDVIQARERLASLRQVQRNDGGRAAIQAQIDANNAAIASLNAARNAALSRANSMIAGQARAPAILEQAMQLENRASALREQYKEVSSNLLDAENSARMAGEQRAERLTLVEAPNLPEEPHFPNRMLVIGASILLGAMLGVALALVAELVSKPLRSPVQVEAMGLPILGLVPILTSTVDGRATRRWSWPLRRRAA